MKKLKLLTQTELEICELFFKKNHSKIIFDKERKSYSYKSEKQEFCDLKKIQFKWDDDDYSSIDHKSEENNCFLFGDINEHHALEQGIIIENSNMSLTNVTKYFKNNDKYNLGKVAERFWIKFKARKVSYNDKKKVISKYFTTKTICLYRLRFDGEAMKIIAYSLHDNNKLDLLLKHDMILETTLPTFVEYFEDSQLNFRSMKKKIQKLSLELILDLLTPDNFDRIMDLIIDKKKTEKEIYEMYNFMDYIKKGKECSFFSPKNNSGTS